MWNKEQNFNLTRNERVKLQTVESDQYTQVVIGSKSEVYQKQRNNNESEEVEIHHSEVFKYSPRLHT
jgi:hypothetical protein